MIAKYDYNYLLTIKEIQCRGQEIILLQESAAKKYSNLSVDSVADGVHYYGLPQNLSTDPGLMLTGIGKPKNASFEASGFFVSMLLSGKKG